MTDDSGTHEFSYDAAGNLTAKKVRATGATTRFVWDSEHRLVELVKPSGATVRYRYDAAGMRVQATRSSDGRVTTWGYNGSTVAAVWRQEPGGSPVLVSTFVTAPSGDPLQSTSDGETVYSVLDGLGSVTGTLDAAGGVASSSAYSVFGQPAGTGPVGLGDVYGYTGHAWDADAGMHFAQARWYDAGVGRFASEDPVDAMNLYPYVGNQPYSYVDPTGEMAVSYAPLAEGGASRSYDAAALAAIGTTNIVVITGVMRLFQDIATHGQVTSGCLYSVFTTLVTGAGFVIAQFSTVHFANGLALKAARYAQAGTALVAFVDYAMSIRPGGACHAK